MAPSTPTGVTSKVLEILAKNPSLSYSAVGGAVGVTRERVRQIAQKNGYPARMGIAKSKPKKICKICGKPFYTKNLYCSADCGYKARRNRVNVICQQCGNTIERPPSIVRNKSGNFFCNRVCYREWVLNNGFMAAKKRKPGVFDFNPETNSKDEIFLKGKIPTPEILKIYNVLRRLSERELVKININGFDDFRGLGRVIKQKSKSQDEEVINTISAIIDIKKHSLLFVMRLTD